MRLILGRLLRRVGAIVGWTALFLLALFGLGAACRFALVGGLARGFVSGLRGFLAVLIRSFVALRAVGDLALVGLASVVRVTGAARVSRVGGVGGVGGVSGVGGVAGCGSARG